MARSRLTLVSSSSRLLAAIALTVAMAATGLVAGTDAEGGTVPGVTPSGTLPTPDISPRPPTAPSNLVATEVKAGSVTLTWTASAGGCCGVEGYDISYNQAFNDIFWLTSIGNVTTATITSDIRPASQYTFRVSARDSVGHRSVSSNAVTVVTPISDTGPDTTPPTAPGNLSAAGPSPDGVALTWSPSTDDTGVTGYNVYWFDGWFTSRLLATVAGTAYTAPVQSGRDTFYVRARDAAGNVSIASGTVTPDVATTPPTTTPPPPAATCRVTYATTAQWAQGFVATVTLTNTGRIPVDGWTLAFTFGGDQRITSSWNGTFSQAGAAVTVKNARWNGVLAPGDSIAFGMQGTWTGSNAPPAGFTLDDLPCTVG